MWLSNDIKSNTIHDEVPMKDLIGDKYFEFDDNTRGVDIEGFLFFPDKVNGPESFSHREFLRTKIMSGGEFTTRGQYIPKEFSFDTIIDIDPENLDDYVNIFGKMENKVCIVTSPYMGGMFKAEVKIGVTHPEASPHVIECKVEIKEIPDVMARLDGDPIIQYPSINTISDITLKEREKKEASTTETNDGGREELYGAYNSSQPGFTPDQ